MCASGAYGSWSGTEGSFEIREVGWLYNILLFQVYFDIPLIGSNKLDVRQILVLPEQKVYNYSLVVGDISDIHSVYATLAIK